MTVDQIVKDTRERMKKAVEHFGDSLKGLRTGRVTPALVESVRAEAYGSPMPLNQLASISVPEPRMLVIKPFDPSTTSAIEKAILKSDLGITPESDGKMLRLPVPMMSQEQRDKMAHRVKDLAEQARVSIRNIRRDQNKAAETAGRDGELGADDERSAKDQIQKLTKDMEAEIDKIAAARTKEIQES